MRAVTRGVPAWLYHLRGASARHPAWYARTAPGRRDPRQLRHGAPNPQQHRPGTSLSNEARTCPGRGGARCWRLAHQTHRDTDQAHPKARERAHLARVERSSPLASAIAARKSSHVTACKSRGRWKVPGMMSRARAWRGVVCKLGVVCHKRVLKQPKCSDVCPSIYTPSSPPSRPHHTWPSWRWK